MEVLDFVSANEDFQASVNIDFDFSIKDKVINFVPTDSVCYYLEEIIKEVLDSSARRAKIFVGPYGTGKSHIALIALKAMWEKDPKLFEGIISGIKSHNEFFASEFAHFVTDGKKLLPVIVSGSASDLRHSLLSSLQNALRLAGFEELMPTTNFNGVVKVINRWKKEFPDTLERFQVLIGMTSESFLAAIQNFDTEVYKKFVEVYPLVTSGSKYDSFDDSEVLDVFDEVISRLDSKGIDGIFVVYDEFSKYLEANITQTSLEDIKLLQDFAEKCDRTQRSKQLHLLLISHKSLTNYINSNLPKDKVDNWRAVSGRFEEIEIRNNPVNSYELMAKAINKNKGGFTEWLNEKPYERDKRLEQIKNKYLGCGLFGEDTINLVVYDCFPLHPISSFLLPRLSEKVAQNERTLFTFLCSAEKKGMLFALNRVNWLVSPDVIFDYFEPLFKREYHESEIYQVYNLARIALQKVEADSVEAKIIKTIVLIDIVGQYELLAPTRQWLLDIFEDCGFERTEIMSALDVLWKAKSVIYLRQSDSFLQLKRSSGVNIEEQLVEQVISLKNKHHNPCELLNTASLVKVFYPSRHNEQNDIIRYFECKFIEISSLKKATESNKILECSGDGHIIAVYCESPDDISSADEIARKYSAMDHLSVVVVPKNYIDISDLIYKYAAALELKDKSSEDEVLSEEYEIALDDYVQVLTDFEDSYFRPELSQSRYFAKGILKNGITRRRKLSDLLSDISDEAYPYTPHITSEALNKNKMTGTAIHSRAKILNNLFASSLEPNLGFVGKGQETSMMRSVLLRTGVIEDLQQPQINMHPSDKGTAKAIQIIEQFVDSAHDSSFESLFKSLTGSAQGIGMKKGPIPVFMALVLRNRRNEITISREGKEKNLSANLLDDISVNPANYSISLLDWSEERADYVKHLGELFGCREDASRTAVVDAMRSWYVSLPQLARNEKANSLLSTTAEEDTQKRLKFHRVIKQVSLDSKDLLFEKLPEIFGSGEGLELVKQIEQVKVYSDNFCSMVAEELALQIKSLFDPGASEEASLYSVLNDWVESLPSEFKTHVFSGTNGKIIGAIIGATPDDQKTALQIAKTANTLRIEDWNAERFKECLSRVAEAKHEADSLEDSRDQDLSGTLSISFIDSKGKPQVRTFNAVECSRRAKLLKNSLRSCLSDMGGALSSDEKRQTVFEILEELCS